MVAEIHKATLHERLAENWVLLNRLPAGKTLRDFVRDFLIRIHIEAGVVHGLLVFGLHFLCHFVDEVRPLSRLSFVFSLVRYI